MTSLPAEHPAPDPMFIERQDCNLGDVSLQMSDVLPVQKLNRDQLPPQQGGNPLQISETGFQKNKMSPVALSLESRGLSTSNGTYHRPDSSTSEDKGKKRAEWNRLTYRSNCFGFLLICMLVAVPVVLQIQIITLQQSQAQMQEQLMEMKAVVAGMAGAGGAFHKKDSVLEEDHTMDTDVKYYLKEAAESSDQQVIARMGSVSFPALTNEMNIGDRKNAVHSLSKRASDASQSKNRNRKRRGKKGRKRRRCRCATAMIKTARDQVKKGTKVLHDNFYGYFWDIFSYKDHFKGGKDIVSHEFEETGLPDKPTAKNTMLTYPKEESTISIFTRKKTDNLVDYDRAVGDFNIKVSGIYQVHFNITIVDPSRTHYAALFLNDQAMMACEKGGFRCPRYNDERSQGSHKYRICNIDGTLELKVNDTLQIRTMKPNMTIRLEWHRQASFKIILLHRNDDENES